MRAIVAQILLAVAFIAFVAIRSGAPLPLVGEDTWTVQVAFPDAGGLSEQSRAPVTVAGVPSGKVSGVEFRDGEAIATLELSEDARDVVKRDAVATVTPRSALMDLTVEITPGSDDGALDPGALITATRAPVTLDEVVAQLDSDTRAHVQVALGELATGLTHRPGALRDAVERLSSTIDPAADVTRALARRRVLLQRLSGELATTFEALGDQDRAMAGAIEGGRRVLGVTSERQADLAATIQALPGAMTSLDGALTEIRRLAEPLQPALSDLLPAAKSLPAALDSVSAATPSLRALVADAGALIDDGAAPLADARSTFEDLGPTAAALQPSIESGDPVVAAIDKNRDGIGLLGERFSGILSTSDANGVILRGLGFFEPFNSANVGFASQADSVRALTNECVTGNPVACLVRYLVPGLPEAIR